MAPEPTSTPSCCVTVDFGALGFSSILGHCATLRWLERKNFEGCECRAGSGCILGKGVLGDRPVFAKGLTGEEGSRPVPSLWQGMKGSLT